MIRSLNNATRNRAFYEQLKKCSPDEFFDWKINALFYEGLHYMKAYIRSKGQDADSHEQITSLVINDSYRSGKIKVSQECWRVYKTLYDYSRVARYDGFTDKTVFEKDRKIDYEDAKKRLNFLLVNLRDKYKVKITTLPVTDTEIKK